MSEKQIYWSVFVAVFLVVATWETLAPLRELTSDTARRWREHAALFAVSAVIATIAIRLLPTFAAEFAVNNPLGILNNTRFPFPVRWVAAVLILDFLQYWIHRSFHAHHPLWRVHEVHHSDYDYDVSLAVRFHPLEILPSQVLHAAAAVLLAAPPSAVFAAQLLSLIVNFLSHANAGLPEPVERLVRTIFITPNLHCIHHSADPGDYGRNFGQTFSIWDRLFGTYTSRSQATEFRTGVDGVSPEDSRGTARLLARPFKVSQ